MERTKSPGMSRRVSLGQKERGRVLTGPPTAPVQGDVLPPRAEALAHPQDTEALERGPPGPECRPGPLSGPRGGFGGLVPEAASQVGCPSLQQRPLRQHSCRWGKSLGLCRQEGSLSLTTRCCGCEAGQAVHPKRDRLVLQPHKPLVLVPGTSWCLPGLLCPPAWTCNLALAGLSCADTHTHTHTHPSRVPFLVCGRGRGSSALHTCLPGVSLFVRSHSRITRRVQFHFPEELGFFRFPSRFPVELNAPSAACS